MTAAEWETSTDPVTMLSWLQGEDLRGHRLYPAFDRQLRLFAVGCCRRPEVWERLVDDAPCGRCGGFGFATRPSGTGGSDCPDCGGTGIVNRSRRAVEVAELFADGLATAEEILAAHESARQAHSNPDNPAASMPMVACGSKPCFVAANIVVLFANMVPLTIQADLLRCVFGSPRRPIVTEREYVTDPIARAIVMSAVHAAPFNPDRDERHEYQERIERSVVRQSWLTPAAVAFARDIYAGRRFEDAPVLADMLEENGCPGDELCGRCNGQKRILLLGAKYPFDTHGCPDCKATGRVPNRLLAHLRSGRQHCRGCHAVELIRGALEAGRVTADE